MRATRQVRARTPAEAGLSGLVLCVGVTRIHPRCGRHIFYRLTISRRQRPLADGLSLPISLFYWVASFSLSAPIRLTKTQTGGAMLIKEFITAASRPLYCCQ